MKRALILFAHGSRDPQWARPFERLAALLSKRVDTAVVLAYLEQMKPSLGEAIDALAKEKIDAVRIVPLFFGTGGHIAEDLPRLVGAARAKHRSLQIDIDAPIGEQDAVLSAIAKAIADR